MQKLFTLSILSLSNLLVNSKNTWLIFAHMLRNVSVSGSWTVATIGWGPGGNGAFQKRKRCIKQWTALYIISAVHRKRSKQKNRFLIKLFCFVCTIQVTWAKLNLSHTQSKCMRISSEVAMDIQDQPLELEVSTQGNSQSEKLCQPRSETPNVSPRGPSTSAS